MGMIVHTAMKMLTKGSGYWTIAGRSKPMDYQSVMLQVDRIIALNLGNEEKLALVAHVLWQEIPHYNWVGFYSADEALRELSLGPFSGEPTEHVTIPFGKGICGQAAERKKAFIVQDVSKELNYLSCSLKVRSEIVVPVFREGRVVGEIDIDSHELHPFTETDEDFLTLLASKVEPYM